MMRMTRSDSTRSIYMLTYDYPRGRQLLDWDVGKMILLTLCPNYAKCIINYLFIPIPDVQGEVAARPPQCSHDLVRGLSPRHGRACNPTETLLPQ